MKFHFKAYLNNILISLIIILLTLEFSPFIIGSFFLNQGYSRKEIQKEIEVKNIAENSQQEQLQDEGYLSEHILHPYLGFIHKPDNNYNEFGFLSQNPVLTKTDTTINICLTGGSVAKQLFQFSGDEIKYQVSQINEFTGKKINLVLVALGGFKQPQQMLAINYLLSLGAEYNFVINIDGFNEVVLPYADNLPFNLHPSFPRHWNVYSRKSLDKNLAVNFGKQAFLVEQMENHRKKFSRSLFRFSNFGLFIWKIQDQEIKINFQESEIQMRENLTRADHSTQSNGPGFVFHDTLDFFSAQVHYWSACSQLMNDLSEKNDFTYFHFLQPNQYVEGSKQLSREELENAYEQGEFNYKEAVRIGYPLLSEEGKILVQKQVRFQDLTQIFKHEKKTVYSDKCCHFNKKGYDVIAGKIAEAIATSIK